jgi:type I restriction enzyme S subunit
MNSAIDITSKQRKTLADILRRYIPGVAVWAYGSRVNWTARSNSDLDLVVFSAPGQLNLVSELKSGLAESDLPFLVDLHVWDEIPERFRRIISKEYVVVQEQSDVLKSFNRVTGWRESTWGEEISLEYGKALRGYSSDKGKYRVYGSNGPIGWHSEALAPGPGVILGRKGAYRGIQFSPEPFYVIDTAYYVVPKNEFDMRWLYYAMVYYKLGEIDDGSPIPSTTRSAVYIRELEIPSLREQRNIAAILGALDNKIELIRKLNETLESIARAIFQSWFVDFDPVRAKAEGREPEGMDAATAALFPDSFQDSEFGLIPNGWSIETIGNLSQRVSMGPFGSNIKTDNFVGKGVPVIRGKNLKGGFVDDDFVFISNEKADELRHANAFPGDIVITHRGTLGQVGRIPICSRFPRYVVSQSQMVLTANPQRATSLFLYYYLISSAGQHQLLANTSQTGVPAIAQPTTSVKAIKIPLSHRIEAIQAFESSVGTLTDHMNSNDAKGRTLAELQAVLLPRLISGKLRVPEAEKIVEAAL